MQPTVTANKAPCADCGVDTFAQHEWYMLRHAIWEQAWRGHARKPPTEFLCIGCLENRIGRRLEGQDFAAVSINDPRRWWKSDRLRARLINDLFSRDRTRHRRANKKTAGYAQR